MGKGDYALYILGEYIGSRFVYYKVLIFKRYL